MLTIFTVNAQTSEPTKEQTIEALKDMLNGQIIHYFYGGPCTNDSGSSYMQANKISIKNIKLNYDILQIEYDYTENDGKLVNNLKRINLNNNLIIYENVILESKEQTVDWKCEGVIGIALPFDKNAKASMEKTLRILNYLKKFIKKSPFE